MRQDHRVIWDFYAKVHQNQQYLSCRAIAKHMEEFLWLKSEKKKKEKNLKELFSGRVLV